MTSKLCPIVLSVLLLTPTMSFGEPVMIPPGTKIYGQFDELVSSDPDQTRVGDVVQGHVWRSVVVDGHTVITAGTPMSLRVSSQMKRRIAGRKGKVTVQALSVPSVDGSEIPLTGGYAEEGENRVVLAGVLAGLVAWPIVFIKGKDAELVPGAIFDASIAAPTTIAVPDQRPTLRLTQVSDLSVDVLYDEIEEKQRDLPLRVTLCDHEWPDQMAVTAVNEVDVSAIPVEVSAVSQDGDCHEAAAGVDLKDLAKHFIRGINRFSLTAGTETVEVVLDVEM